MTATDELRMMLTDAGVEWEDYQHESHTWWLDGNDVCWHAENRLTPSGMLLKIEATLTPAQAIAATVGRGTCHMETADGCQNWNSCSECGADYYTDQPINYCPNCGRRVVAE